MTAPALSSSSLPASPPCRRGTELRPTSGGHVTAGPGLASRGRSVYTPGQPPARHGLVRNNTRHFQTNAKHFVTIVQMFSSVLIFRVRFRFLVEKDTSFEFIDTSYISEYFKHVCKHLDMTSTKLMVEAACHPLVFTMWLARPGSTARCQEEAAACRHW